MAHFRYPRRQFRRQRQFRRYFRLWLERPFVEIQGMTFHGP